MQDDDDDCLPHYLFAHLLIVFLPSFVGVQRDREDKRANYTLCTLFFVHGQGYVTPGNHMATVPW